MDFELTCLKLQAFAGNTLCGAVCMNCFEKCIYCFTNVNDDSRNVAKQLRKIVKAHLTGLMAFLSCNY